MLDGPPIKMAVLSKPNNVWVASESADDQEAGQFIASIEDRIGVITHRHFRRADRDEAPDFRAPLPGSPISESMCAWIALICSA